MKDKDIFALSICALLYFSFLALNAYYFKFQYIAIGFIQELFTIPIIIGQLVLLVVSFIRFKRINYSIKSWTFVSMIILFALNCFVVIIFITR
jgi:hypothetical protein